MKFQHEEILLLTLKIKKYFLGRLNQFLITIESVVLSSFIYGIRLLRFSVVLSSYDGQLKHVQRSDSFLSLTTLFLGFFLVIITQDNFNRHNTPCPI